MKTKIVNKNIPLLSLVVLSALMIHHTHGLYFYINRGEVKCFKDELIKNSVTWVKWLTFVGSASTCYCGGRGNQRTHEQQS